MSETPDVNDVTRNGGMPPLASLPTLQPSAALKGASKTRFTLKPDKTRAWLTNAPPPRRGLLFIEQSRMKSIYLSRGHPGLLIAEGGFGKTYFLTQLCIAVATGGKPLGAKSPLSVEKPMAVLFIAAEEPDDELHRRVHRLASDLPEEARALLSDNLHAHGMAGMDASLLSVPGVNRDPEMTPFLEEILAILDQPPPGGGEWGVVILDPAARLGPTGFENDQTLATRFVECLERMCATRDRPPVILAHHTNKASRAAGAGQVNASAARGSSALTDAARWVGSLGPGDSSAPGTAADVLLSVVKSNYTKKPTHPLRLARGAFGELVALGEGEIPDSVRSMEAAELKDLEEHLQHVVAVLKRTANLNQTELMEALHAKRQSMKKAKLPVVLAAGEARGLFERLAKSGRATRWALATVGAASEPAPQPEGSMSETPHD